MRSTWWLALVAFVVICVSLAPAGSKPAPTPTTTRIAGGAVIVDGYGWTQEAARTQALLHAQEQVESLLQERFGKSGWRPTPAQLDSDYLRDKGVVTEEEVTQGPNMENERAFVAKYRVQLTPVFVQELLDSSRQERIQDRHVVVARVFVALVALSLVTTGYLRAEEYTRGYATKLLRLAGAVILGIVALGLWLTA